MSAFDAVPIEQNFFRQGFLAELDGAEAFLERVQRPVDGAADDVAKMFRACPSAA